MIVEIVILAMIAAFLGLRLYSVLGQRAEHEEEHVPKHFDTPVSPRALDDRTPAQATPQFLPQIEGALPAVERGVREIAAADRRFEIISFLEGAKGAYAMILEAFWQGDRATLKQMCDADVYAGFEAAIAAREAAGETLDNRLIRIEDTKIHSASLDGRTARISVLFVADIAALTRDKDGAMIAGSLDDAVETRDIWTFVRQVDSMGPDWLLDETDEG